MFRKKLTHADQAKVCKIRLTIGITLGQILKLRQVLPTIEVQHNQSLVQHFKNVPGIGVKRSFGKNGLAGQTGFGQLRSQTNRPIVMFVPAIDECDEESGISDCFHALVE